MSTVRVLVVDDHPIFRDGVRAAMASSLDLELVGEAADGAAAAEAVTRLEPDVVLMDLNLPGIGGIEAIRRINAGPSQPAILVVTMHEDDDSLFAAVRAGASGYLLKGTGQDELVRALHAVAAGEAVFGSGVARRVLAYFDTARLPDLTPLPALTERELEILDLVARGRGNQAIARQLHLSAKTIRNNVSTIIGKLHARDRGEAVQQARAAGLGADPTRF